MIFCIGTEGALDLAHLLFKLEQWEMAETTLSHVPLQEKALLLSKVTVLNNVFYILIINSLLKLIFQYLLF